ncbi:DUF6766 family protein [Janibacter terrae]|uniref:DUF6766 family protein n=1 Tax=Janibacter terrae TaxID=103817 RepID=UPI000838F45D|nr:DUF6766 family protein [Janibacter terrae]
MSRSWIRDHALLLANLALFVIFLVGMVVAGTSVYNETQMEHGQPGTSLLGYLKTPDLVEATFENWESEFLQMGMYVLLTAKLVTVGSSESKPLEGFEGDEDPRDHAHDPDAPGPVRRGGWLLRLYEHSLGLWFLAWFLLSIVLHALGGAAAYSEEQVQHGGEPVGALSYVTTSQFWFESFQNWQSEFLAVAAIVFASIWLRQRGSAESKPVHAPHRQTGSS